MADDISTDPFRWDHTDPDPEQRQAAYDRLWAIEIKAEELFKAEHPTGNFNRNLPQFRSSYPDPVGDHYRHLAAYEHDQREAAKIIPLNFAIERRAELRDSGMDDDQIDLAVTREAKLNALRDTNRMIEQDVSRSDRDHARDR